MQAQTLAQILTNPESVYVDQILKMLSFISNNLTSIESLIKQTGSGIIIENLKTMTAISLIQAISSMQKVGTVGQGMNFVEKLEFSCF